MQTIAAKGTFSKNDKGRGRRGEIKGWSAHSRGRLRSFLLSVLPPEGWAEVGVTLTVPGPIITPEEWRRIFHVFSQKVSRAGAAGVWRVELQQREQPHLHAILWGPDLKTVKRLGNESWPECLNLLGPCQGALKTGRVIKVSSRVNWPGADVHAVDVKASDGRAGWWRYLCDHASKSKQAQLGWKGRQWGVLGRQSLSTALPDVRVALTEKEFAMVLRMLRRLTRAVHAGRGKKGRSVWFSSPATVARMIDLAQHGVITVPQGESTVYTPEGRKKLFEPRPAPPPLSAEGQRAVDLVRAVFAPVGP